MNETAGIESVGTAGVNCYQHRLSVIKSSTYLAVGHELLDSATLKPLGPSSTGAPTSRKTKTVQIHGKLCLHENE